MKQLSILLNIILLLAVGFLYYLHFSGMRRFKNLSEANGNNAAKCLTAKGPVIAYVELDSVNNNVAFIKQQKDELDAEQKSIASNYENQYRELEAEKDNFLKRGNAITQQEAQDFQQKLLQKQQEIEADKQERSEQLAEKGAKVMEDMQSKVKDFLNDYNQQKKYTYILETGTGLDYLLYKDSTLNITQDIVKGLNDKMKQAGN
jgi:outer membrane protein